MNSYYKRKPMMTITGMKRFGRHTRGYMRKYSMSISNEYKTWMMLYNMLTRPKQNLPASNIISLNKK